MQLNGVKRSIKEWPTDERPREKAMRNGISTLSNSELLAIIVGSGAPDVSAVELMKSVLASCNDSIANLARLTVDDLCLFRGIGPAKAISIVAACELWKRRANDDMEERPKITASTDLFRYFHPLLCDLNIEQCYVLLLNNRNKVIDHKIIGSGGLTSTTVDIRIVMREAIMKHATAIALCHNHPSGNTSPSKDDNVLTKNLYEACKVMNIRFLDHIIVAGNKYFSYSDEDCL